jgi:hypothetical protein
MHIINKNALLWDYLPPDIKGLIDDGEILLDWAQNQPNGNLVSDYSFLVFPFAKGYEGFLKKFLLDLNLIHPEEYFSDDIRIGRILNPKYVKESDNVFHRICDHSKEGTHISQRLWDAWKRGRNSVFHYFPHNFKKLSYEEALEIIHELANVMEACLTHCKAPALEPGVSSIS